MLLARHYSEMHVTLLFFVSAHIIMKIRKNRCLYDNGNNFLISSLLFKQAVTHPAKKLVISIISGAAAWHGLSQCAQ